MLMSDQAASVDEIALGWVSYANFYPVASLLAPELTGSFELTDKIGPTESSSDNARYRWMEGTPSIINRHLEQHQLHVALTSSVHLVNSPAFTHFAPVGICARGSVGSVYLEVDPPSPQLMDYISEVNECLRRGWDSYLTHNSWCQWKAQSQLPPRPPSLLPLLDLGVESQCSATLALILYELWFGEIHPQKHSLTQWRLKSRAEARSSSPLTLRLHLGDAALQRRKIHKMMTLDLAQMWWQITGLPFVFATWVQGRKRCSDVPSAALKRLRSMIMRTTQKAHEKLHQNPCSFFSSSSQIPLRFDLGALSEEEMIYYWQHCLHYHIGHESSSGLHAFLRLAREVLWIPFNSK